MISITHQHIQTIFKLMWNFLWNGKHVRIPRNVCTLPREMGGLGLPNIEILIKVRRIKTLISIVKNKGSWNLLARKHLCFLDKVYGNIPWFALCADDTTDEIMGSDIPLFYKECLLAYQEMCRKA